MATKRLDESTLKELADLISYGGRVPGYIGNVPQTVSENREFFERAGVEAVLESISSELNTFDSLKKFNSEESGKLLPHSLEQVLLRFADPKEYGGDRKITDSVVFRLNRLLWPEGLKVVLEGATPWLREIEPSAAASSTPQGYLPAPDLRRIVADQGLLEILVSRWEEAQKCMGVGAYRSAVIMMGSILEGALRHQAETNPKIANSAKSAPRDIRTGKPKAFKDWGLSDFINVGRDVGWLHADVQRFSHMLREYRNLVHPYEELSLRQRPDSDTCDICWDVVKAAINDLLQGKAPGKP